MDNSETLEHVRQDIRYDHTIALLSYSLSLTHVLNLLVLLAMSQRHLCS